MEEVDFLLNFEKTSEQLHFNDSVTYELRYIEAQEGSNIKNIIQSLLYEI